MQDFYEACPSNVKSELIQADSTKPVEEIEPDSVDIVVTSPPYGDSRTTVAYGQFCRLSSQWIGLLPEKATDIDREMLGGNGAKLDNQMLDSPLLSHITKLIAEKDSRRAQQVYAFYADLFKALENIAKYVRHGGHACIVIGNRRVKSIQLPTDAIICELSQGIQLTPLHIIVRNIPSKTMPWKNSPTNVAGIVEETMHKEYILILKKS
jgi:DNA modification methylase